MTNMSKETAKKRGSSKLAIVVLAIMMAFCGVIGGTVAWLIDSSQSVVNTFTYGDINITLEETDTNLDGDNDPNTNEFEMMPGQDIAKDPTVTVEADSEANWLFVKLQKSDNFDDFLTYTIADGWTQLLDGEGNAVEGVYYRFQSETDVDVSYGVLKDDKVTVLDTVTKEDLNALDPEGQDATYPTLTVTAYAVQYVGFEAEVSEGSDEATAEQVNAAAFKAWGAMEAQRSTANQ